MFKVSVVFVIVYIASEIQCNLFLVKTKDEVKTGEDYSDSRKPPKNCACPMVMV